MTAQGPERLVEIARAKGVSDRRLLAALAAVDRAEYVPRKRRNRAYRDEPIPIPHEQVTTQPSLSAAMIEALALEGDERVLEVGTGLGFQTALLARLAARVFSVERFADLAATARDNLARHGVGNVEVAVGDGSSGLPEKAPFDAILVSAAFTAVPEPLAAQLAERGRLVQPVGPGGRDDVTLFERQGSDLRRLGSVVPAHFVKLYGEHGFGGGDRLG